MPDMLRIPTCITAIAALAMALVLGACEPQQPDAAPAEPTSREYGPKPSASESVVADEVPQPAMGAQGAALPDAFAEIGRTEVAGGGICVVGSLLSEDGDARAWVHMLDAGRGALRWSTPIALQGDYFQNRATHCLCRDDLCRVLVATDTQSSQSLSQTLLSITTLSLVDGRFVSSTPITSVPGAPGNASVWVEPGEANFAWNGDSLMIRGRYRVPDSDAIGDFEIVDMALPDTDPL